jgi:hypothetical protein
MSNSRCWSHDHTGSGHMSSPAEFEIFAVKRNRCVVTTESFEKIGTNQCDCTGDKENIADGVVLLLIKIATFDVGRGMTEPVGTHSDGKQTTSIVPLDEFWSDNSGIGSECLFDQEAHGIRLKANVVVAEQIERRSLNSNKRFVRRYRIAGIFRKSTKVGVGKNGTDPISKANVIGAPGVNHENRKSRIILSPEAGQGLFEP